ncbi:hypothetical protein TIFTF001_020612 [Ficus carica]|uniref:DUF8039 domain-containing protein n=1 Tax=Ficus carica TaxID=3494 RepID=A0AA88A8W6_FICCA|nr:hypothetical protein TIFTF001_020612 [Ficus carica]
MISRIQYVVSTRVRSGLVHGLSWTGLVAPTTPWQRTTVSDLPAILDAILWRVGAADCEKWNGHHHGFWKIEKFQVCMASTLPRVVPIRARSDLVHDLGTQGDYNERQTQGSFESIGTSDILTNSNDNTEVSVVKCQLVALEKTVQELCAKHGIDRETMAEENTAPTIDQHNSFKANCTFNEKEHGVSDQQLTPNESKECQLFFNDIINGEDVFVAIGRVYMNCVSTDTVRGIPLGEENMRVTITVPKLKHALLPMLKNEATIMEEAIGGFVAWPKRLIIIDTSLSQTSRGPSHVLDE